MADSLILMVLALVVFGPRRLPQIGRQIGKLMYEFRKASNDFKFQMEEELRRPRRPTGASRKRKRGSGSCGIEQRARESVRLTAAGAGERIEAPIPMRAYRETGGGQNKRGGGDEAAH